MATPASEPTNDSTPEGVAVRLVNEHVAADILCLKVSTLRRWRWANRGPASHKIGFAVRYSMADLTAFMAAGRHPTLDQGDIAEAPAPAAA